MMSKVTMRTIFIGLMSVILTACQTSNRSNKDEILYKNEIKNNPLIFCSGAVLCEFERFNAFQIIDAKTHKVDQKAIQKGIVRLGAQSKDLRSLYLSVPAGLHEVVVRFYPVSLEKAETINVIHRFEDQKKYAFVMFRDRSDRKTSLLDASAPKPLCVDLLQDQKTIRRFCRPYNVLNGLGEFVEQKKFKSVS